MKHYEIAEHLESLRRFVLAEGQEFLAYLLSMAVEECRQRHAETLAARPAPGDRTPVH